MCLLIGTGSQVSDVAHRPLVLKQCYEKDSVTLAVRFGDVF